MNTGIKFYYRERCISSLKARDWFKSHNLIVQHLDLMDISQKDLLHLVSLTEIGLEEILKNKGRFNRKFLERNFQFSNKSLVESLSFLETHTEFLRSPIILSEDKYMLGFNTEEIRQFLPPIYRELERAGGYSFLLS
ncbi:ArsC/Spx/MgsR family protein [Lactococcus petauri]|uniref:ArsC/Spx/MgsR family protein n=1 Tax=Lactococcus petauri TaxID=1940789 RepID=UPI00254D644C|nr:ArsC/Spx/MgsR family protein [Lactococcus petauri]